jgi:hypothetical protein
MRLICTAEATEFPLPAKASLSLVPVRMPHAAGVPAASRFVIWPSSAAVVVPPTAMP